ncbi:MAG: hypothetical protein EHM58_17740 [Ignavibacteriae bacterium]|nr:MAG: hypothetical protein EHM58_17740 [Ignavibacteriota bacterium]
MHKTNKIIFLSAALLYLSCSNKVPVDIIQPKVCEKLSACLENNSDKEKVVRLLFGREITTDEGIPLFVSKNHDIKFDKVEILSSEEIEISDVTKVKIKVTGAANTFCLMKKNDNVSKSYFYAEEDHGEKKFENTFYAIFWKENSGWSCDLSIW